MAAESVVLRNGGCCVVLDLSGGGAARVLHLGADLAGTDDQIVSALRGTQQPWPRNNYFDVPTWLSLLPGESEGWLGQQGISGHRDGVALLPRLVGGEVEVTGATAVLTCADDESGISVRSDVALEPGGLLRLRHSLTNTGQDLLDLSALQVTLPLPGTATEVLDLTGRWCRERSPQRHRLDLGTRLRETRRGRTGHDAPTVMAVGTPGFGFGHGTVLGAHLGWSGNSTYRAEHRSDPVANAEGVIVLGESLDPGEVRLGAGETYETPWVYVGWSDRGLDGLAERFHSYQRSRPRHPSSPRPVVLNVWEAVYFDHDLQPLKELADVAAQVGIERFVLDDGWFRHRRDDTAGLGDWYVDEQVWPEGLHPIVDHVRGLGMQVGLWFEPEMINLDSDLARAHPDWLLAPPGRIPLPSRNQQVLDLGRPEASAYLLGRIDALVTEYRLDYIKWDHNRDFAEAVHAPTGQYGVHRQTEALYALLAQLRSRHPGLEIESCSSGGARVDLGILQHTDRVWASDCNDAIERQMIQRWTSQLLPPELIGSHVGPPVSHTTGRHLDLDFRAITAFFWHTGFEWDLTTCSPEELDALRAYVALHKRFRGLLHSGVVVRSDLPDEGVLLHGVVSADRSEAVFAYARTASSAPAAPGRVPLPGLDPARQYDTEVLIGVEGRALSGVPGSVLIDTGLQMPPMWPGTAQLLHIHSAG